MSNNFIKTNQNSFRSSSNATYDAGLREYMMKVYNKMGIALAISGVISFLVLNSPSLMNMIYNTPLKWVAMLAPLGFVFYFSAKINKISAKKAQTYLWVFASLMGISLAPILYMYTEASIAKTFFIAASLFGSMSLYGYTTKRDLTGMGSFLMMGLFGIILASIVNMFLNSSGLDFAISIIGVLIFTGLTAYDTQRIKSMYYQMAGNAESIAKASTMGALSLYMDFINLFIMLLRFFGDRR
ncbi:MAG: FtsH-binding integral membrane protein [Rickettsiales bacterium]|jgi:FtsH-binding integral membrane protein